MKEIKASEYIQFVRPTYIYLKLTPNNSIRNNATDGIAKAIASLYTSVWEQIDIEERKLIEFFGYIYLKLTPNNSIRNNATDGIAKAIASLYTSVWEQIDIEERKLIEFFGKEWILGTKFKVNQRAKVVYYVYMEKGRVEFYFIIPKQHLNILKERIRSAWSNLTIEEVSDIPLLERATNYQMIYKYEDGVSVAVDRRDNSLLKSNINILNSLEETDKVALIYNFIPTSQYGWNSIYRETLTKIKYQTSVWEQIDIEERKLIEFFGKEWILGTKFKVNQRAKVVYYVYMEKGRVEFYFIIPKQHLNILKERIRSAWSNLTIEEVSDIPLLERATNYQMIYKYEDGVSVAVDRRDNSLLKSNINILNSLEETDKVALIYNFIPTSQYGWNSIYRETLTKIKYQKSIEKNRLTLRNGLIAFVDAIGSFFKGISDVFADKK